MEASKVSDGNLLCFSTPNTSGTFNLQLEAEFDWGATIYIDRKFNESIRTIED